jgi:hypothetical protein
MIFLPWRSSLRRIPISPEGSGGFSGPNFRQAGRLFILRQLHAMN